MAGSDVNDQSGEHCYGVTPLHDAAENGHLEVVKLLLSYGASINFKDSRVSRSVRPSYKNPETWPKNLSRISPKMFYKSPVSPLKNPMKTPKNLFKKSHNIKKLGDLW